MFKVISSRVRFYARATSYFRADWLLLGILVLLIGLSTLLGLLAPWPIAVLADSVLTPQAHIHQDWAHRLFLAPLPSSIVGQIVGLAVLGLLIKVMGSILETAQTVV